MQRAEGETVENRLLIVSSVSVTSILTEPLSFGEVVLHTARESSTGNPGFTQSLVKSLGGASPEASPF
jgi:hypothetical protein